LIRGLGESLGLAPGQCYDDVPETTTTTAPPTTLAPTSEGETTTTEATTTAEPTAPTTTIPRPPLVAIVECEGTNKGVVFATFCIGSIVEDDELVDIPSELGVVECDGDPDLAWPGDRLLRRAAARECVARFEDVFDGSITRPLDPSACSRYSLASLRRAGARWLGVPRSDVLLNEPPRE